jgi:hypothetical protein
VGVQVQVTLHLIPRASLGGRFCSPGDALSCAEIEAGFVSADGLLVGLALQGRAVVQLSHWAAR